ncbi:MAG: alpha/beta hydrolase, partial [Christensenellaceae bacterium]|nr:alpha/beta hydrolase [Christensenellaceae bacterium]
MDGEKKKNTVKVNVKGIKRSRTFNPEERDIILNGVKIHYAVAGNGRPLLLIHGNGGSHKEMLGLMRLFSCEYTVYALDSRCQGKSQKTDELSYEAMTGDVKAFIDTLNLYKPYVIGHSDGGIVAIMASALYPETLGAAVVLGANSSPEGLQNFFIKFLNLINRSKKNRLLALMQDEPHLTRETLSGIRTPVFVVAGEYDLIKYSDTAFLHENIPGSRIAVIKGAGHGTAIVRPKIGYRIAKD